jgi:Fe-S-cluster containining protein
MFIGFGDAPNKAWLQQDEQVAPGWSERDLIKGLTHLYGMMGRAQDQAERSNGLPCKAACSWCCENVTVLLTHAEWMLVLKHLGTAEPKLARRVLRKALIDHKKHGPAIERISADQEGATELAAAIKSPCPMLENNLCTVYEARPHDCRMYGCSFKAGELNACHLVLDAVAGKEVTLPAYEASVMVLNLYPRTELRQTFAYWAKHHLPEALKQLAYSQEPPA